MNTIMKPRWWVLLALVIALASVAILVGCLAREVPPVPMEGDFSAQASIGPRPHIPYLTHLYTEVNTDTWYILVDLDDTTNYPHIHTNSIIFKSLHWAGDLAAATHWDWNVGVVTSINVTTTNVEWVTGGARNRAVQFDRYWCLSEHGLNLLVDNGSLLFVGTQVSETNVITSGTVLSGSAYITSTAEVGDLILYLDEEADNVYLHFVADVAYDTE